MRLVDVDELKKQMCNECFGGNCGYRCYEWTLMNNAPTVDPVKHGHWVEQEHEDWKWLKEYRCSECGKYRLVTTPVGREWNYCPYCGAKMEVEEDD